MGLFSVVPPNRTRHEFVAALNCPRLGRGGRKAKESTSGICFTFELPNLAKIPFSHPHSPRPVLPVRSSQPKQHGEKMERNPLA